MTTTPARNRYDELEATQRVFVNRLINALASAPWHADHRDILTIATNAVDERTRAVMNRRTSR